MKDACSWLAMAVVLAVSAASAGISPELACALDRADATGESLPVVLTLQSPIEISSLARGIGLEHISPEARVPALIACLQEYFRLTLSERMSRLSSLPAVTDLRGYWAGSMIAFRAPS
jgi:hypothetical protein